MLMVTTYLMMEQSPSVIVSRLMSLQEPNLGKNIISDHEIVSRLMIIVRTHPLMNS